MSPDDAPLISILMPVYEAATTLPLALASMQAQTWTEWECILVDDGSGPSTQAVLDKIQDPRIRRIRLERNTGRGRARQVAMEHVRGEFVCMLDADDWMVPWRLETQVRALRSEPDLALVTSGMFLIDDRSELLGIRVLPGRQRMPGVHRAPKALRTPDIPYAPCMVRAALARGVGFDPAFRRSEDLDFLLRLLPEVLYAYRVRGSVESFEQRLLESLDATAKVWRKQRGEDPREALRQEMTARIKRMVYRVVCNLGGGPWLLDRWVQAPRGQEHAQFDLALGQIRQMNPWSSGMM